MIHVGQSEFDQHEIENVLHALSHNWVTQGRWVEQFEREFAEFVGANYAVAVSNGTAALHLALVALGIGEGDEVIVPATTFIATANAVTYTGATPVIVDVDPETWCIDINKVLNAITPKTKAIIPVHLYGNPVTLNRLEELLEVLKRNIYVVEDCAEALGTYTDFLGVKYHVGTLSEFGCFSFYGNKTITTGEGGMVVTDDENLYNKLRLLRGQGQSERRYWHEVVGYNYRMTDLQGALGVGQMAKLERFLQARHSLMQTYLDNLPLHNGLTAQKISNNGTHGCWAMAVLFESVAQRVEVETALRLNEIETRPIFYPLSNLPPYKKEVEFSNEFEPSQKRIFSEVHLVADKLSKQGLVLPLHPGLTEQDVIDICTVIEEAMHVYSKTA